MSNELQVIFGAGPVGLAIMDELLSRGKAVRIANRSGKRTPDMPAEVEVVAADATDPTSTRKVARGATVVYNATNPLNYHKWPEEFPPLQAGVLEGAASAGAKLVVMENVYMYGPTGGKPLTEDLPHKATGPRGRTRVQMAKELQLAHTSGKLRVVSGRASDFFGPRVRNSAAGEQVFRAALAGKKAQVMVNTDNPHTFSYVPDIGKGLVELGERDEALGQAWHLPNASTVTTRQFLSMVYAAAGKELAIQVAPKPLMRLMGLFIPGLRNISELFYEFEEPFVIDHHKYEQAFGNHTTPMRAAIKTTLEWYKNN